MKYILAVIISLAEAMCYLQSPKSTQSAFNGMSVIEVTVVITNSFSCILLHTTYYVHIH